MRSRCTCSRRARSPNSERSANTKLAHRSRHGRRCITRHSSRVRSRLGMTGSSRRPMTTSYASLPAPRWSAPDRGSARSCPAAARIPVARAQTGTTGSPAPAQQARDQLLVERAALAGHAQAEFAAVVRILDALDQLPPHQRGDGAADGGFVGPGAMRRCIARCRRRCGSRASPARAIPECRARSASRYSPDSAALTSAASRLRRNGTNPNRSSFGKNRSNLG